MANCNNAPHWIFGRKHPFPTPNPVNAVYSWMDERLFGLVAPRDRMSMGTMTIQENPFAPNSDAYLRYLREYPPNGLPPSLTLSYFGSGDVDGMDYTYGRHHVKQEWVISRLESLYQSSKIQEQELYDLINDRIDWTAYYLYRINYSHGTTLSSANWFQAAYQYVDTLNLQNESDILGLLTTLNTWAQSSSLADDSLDPVKWRIFWHHFRGSRPCMTTLDGGKGWHMFAVPYCHEYYWPDLRPPIQHPQPPYEWPRLNGPALNAIRGMLVDAATYTVEGTRNLSTLFRLNQMALLQVPFEGSRYGVTGSDWSLKRTYFKRWIDEPSSQTQNPKMEVGLLGFLPLLVRFSGDGTLDDRRVWAMSCNVVSDNLGLPEWSGGEGIARYRLSFDRSAAGTLTSMKLKETELQGSYSFTVYRR